MTSPTPVSEKSAKRMAYPLVMTNVAIESGPVEIVDLPIDSMVIFHSYVNVYQRVHIDQGFI